MMNMKSLAMLSLTTLLGFSLSANAAVAFTSGQVDLVGSVEARGCSVPARGPAGPMGFTGATGAVGRTGPNGPFAYLYSKEMTGPVTTARGGVDNFKAVPGGLFIVNTGSTAGDWGLLDFSTSSNVHEFGLVLDQDPLGVNGNGGLVAGLAVQKTGYYQLNIHFQGDTLSTRPGAVASKPGTLGDPATSYADDFTFLALVVWHGQASDVITPSKTPAFTGSLNSSQFTVVPSVLPMTVPGSFTSRIPAELNSTSIVHFDAGDVISIVNASVNGSVVYGGFKGDYPRAFPGHTVNDKDTNISAAWTIEYVGDTL